MRPPSSWRKAGKERCRSRKLSRGQLLANTNILSIQTRRVNMSDALAIAISDLEEDQTLKLVQERLAAGTNPQDILASCRDGMALVGKRYEAGEYFVSELIMAGEMFKQTN